MIRGFDWKINGALSVKYQERIYTNDTIEEIFLKVCQQY